MLRKPWFLFCLFVGWCWLCLQWYCCWMQVACPSCSNEIVNPYAMGFQQNEIDPEYGAGIASFTKQLQQRRSGEQQLEVTGKFFLNEKNGRQLADLRAQSVANYLQSNMGLAETPTLRTQQIWQNAPSLDTFFQAIDVQWVATTPPAPTLALERIFYFDKAISQTRIKAEDSDYLQELVEVIKSDTRKILVTGHTDNSGVSATNVLLAERRAAFIAKKLMELGVAADRIIVANKADKEPLLPNTSEKNRAKNRRAELKVID